MSSARLGPWRHLPHEPGASIGPCIAWRCAGRHPGTRRDFLDGHPGEDAKFHQLGRLRVNPAQRDQRVVEVQQVIADRVGREVAVQELTPLASSARRWLLLRRARSTRMRRIASAAAAKK